MSVESYQREVNSLDRDIANLEKKKSECDKKCAELQGKISSTLKSINKNTSDSMKSSKLRQINGYQDELNKKTKDSADLGKKIAEKRERRNSANLKLQKEQLAESKKQQQEYKKMQQSYEKRILDLQQNSVPKLHHPSIGNLVLDKSSEEYDVFVSHAWEDKADFVDELVDEMRKVDLKVWYDTNKLKWGDSMREKIDNGLRKSKYGIVVLSPNYIAENKYWTKAELNGLFQMETINGKTILPIWHNLTKKQVTEYSPIIADRKAMTTADYTASEMAETLKDLFVSEE